MKARSRGGQQGLSSRRGVASKPRLTVRLARQRGPRTTWWRGRGRRGSCCALLEPEGSEDLHLDFAPRAVVERAHDRMILTERIPASGEGKREAAAFGST